MKKLAAIFLMLTLSIPANALIFGGTILGFTGYDDNSCFLYSTKPYQPYEFNSQYEIDSYNMEVESYNTALNQYRQCITEYIENADNDIKRIQEKVNKAIDEFNMKS